MYRWIFLGLTSVFLAGCQVEMTAWLATEWGETCADRQTVQEEMVFRVNQARQQAQTCGSLTQSAVAVVAWRDALRQAATAHAADMAEFHFVAHRGSDGASSSLRLEWTGYQASAMAELIAADFTDAAAAVDFWLSREDTCEALMDARFAHVGAACEDGWDGEPKTYWSLVLAAP